MVPSIPIPRLCFSLLCNLCTFDLFPLHVDTQKKKNQFRNDCETERGGEQTQRPSSDRQGVMCSVTIPIEPTVCEIKANSNSPPLNRFRAWLHMLENVFAERSLLHLCTMLWSHYYIRRNSKWTEKIDQRAYQNIQAHDRIVWIRPPGVHTRKNVWLHDIVNN